MDYARRIVKSGANRRGAGAGPPRNEARRLWGAGAGARLRPPAQAYKTRYIYVRDHSPDSHPLWDIVRLLEKPEDLAPPHTRGLKLRLLEYGQKLGNYIPSDLRIKGLGRLG